MSLIVQFWGALLTQIAIARSIAIPSTPAYIGSFEAGTRFPLGIYAIPVGSLIASAIAMRFLMCVTIPVIAGIITISLGLWKKKPLETKASP